MYDLLITNGLIIDGTGSAPYRADVAVSQGDIVAIGSLPGTAQHTLDAAGLVVAPGFIDLHTHSDLSFLLDPTAQSKVRQGVTLELAGNCGSSFCAPLQGMTHELLQSRVSQYTETFTPTWSDFGGYLDAVQRAGATLNLAVQVGHGTVRSCVLGMEARAASAAELERMKTLVAESLDAGAMGFSTGLFYTPGSYAGLEEVIDLAAVAAARGKLYSTHMRDEGSHNVGLFVALNEAIEIGRRTGIRVQISHVKCMGPAVWGRAGDVLDLFERTRREGIDLAGDQYPYLAGSTSLTGALFPRWALEGGVTPRCGAWQIPRTGANSTRTLRRIFANGVTLRALPSPASCQIAHFEGMNMVQIATELGCDPAEAALRLYERAEAAVIARAMQDADVEAIACHPLIAVGSDGSSLAASGVLSVGKPHPRSYGTNPRFLAQFVRQRRLMSLPEAIRKMTTLPASRLGLTRRGRLAPGYAADLVVFDPDTIADTATFEAPHSYPTGVAHVAVNGVLVVEHGAFTRSHAGKVIRSFAD